VKKRVQLREIAAARSGDKGNTSNISIWPYDASHYEQLKPRLTADFVKNAFRHLFRGKVERYDLDALGGFNFVLHDALEGGVSRSLNLDSHGKSFSFLLLSLEVEIDVDATVGSDVSPAGRRLRRQASTPGRVGVSEAIERRSAVRAFKPDPVDPEMISEILDTARLSPSGGNLQPWIVHVVLGRRLDALRALAAERLRDGLLGENEYQVYPSGLWEPHRSWRRAAGSGRYDALGFPEKSEEGRRELMARNLRFFGAPAGLFFCIDRRMGPPQWADLGMYMQNVMLLAVERGLDTCPQAVWSNAGTTVSRFLDLPQNVMLFAGMALGYRDPDDPLCVVETDRAATGAHVFFHDGDDV
jgi:nitroreductase